MKKRYYTRQSFINYISGIFFSTERKKNCVSFCITTFFHNIDFALNTNTHVAFGHLYSEECQHNSFLPVVIRADEQNVFQLSAILLACHAKQRRRLFLLFALSVCVSVCPSIWSLHQPTATVCTFPHR